MARRRCGEGVIPLGEPEERDDEASGGSQLTTVPVGGASPPPSNAPLHIAQASTPDKRRPGSTKSPPGRRLSGALTLAPSKGQR